MRDVDNYDAVADVFYSNQMGMMKEHVRGPIKGCETLAADLCLKMRAEELVYNEHFHSVEQVSRNRRRVDDLGGNSTVRVVGASCVLSNLDVLRAVLSILLDEIADTNLDGAWQPEDHQHEDLLIQEYPGARVGSSTHFCVDWRLSHKETSVCFLYYSLCRIIPPSAPLAGKPMEPSMSRLESMDTPPPNFIHQMQDFCNHHYFGQVINM